MPRACRISKPWLVGLEWMLVACAGASATAGGSGYAAAQTDSARDRLVRAEGTAIVRGVVVAADTGLPLRRARVEVTLMAAARFFVSTETDAEGRFEFSRVPNGQLRVSARKSGFFDPGSDPKTTPVRITVRDGQVVENLVVRLPRAGAIAGRILDDQGEPVEGAHVDVMRWERSPAGRRLQTVGSSRFETDDTGAFRVWGLPPGQYLVSAQPTRFLPVDESWQGSSKGFAPSFFPGTSSPSEAQQVDVRGGSETAGVVFGLVPAPLATVRGRVIVPEGRADEAVMVSVTRVEQDRFGSSSSGLGLQSDHTFSVSRLSPGLYRFVAQAQNRERTGRARLMASTEVRVDGADVDGVTLALRTGTTLSGRVVTDNGTPLPSNPLTVSLVSRFPESRFDQARSERVAADGVFQIDGLFGEMLIRAGVSGPSSLSTSAPRADGPMTVASGAGGVPAGAPPTTAREAWGLKAVYVKGRDVTDEPIDFERGDVEAEIVLTTGLSEVAGTVSGGQRTVSDPRPMIYIFVDDPDWWVPSTRRVRQVMAGADGRFRTRGLPPGDRYLAVAVEGTPQPASWSPDLLKALRDSATPFRIDEGGLHELSLRVVARPDIDP
ncbi:MAG: carboxypeptidase-like regulatory domain-containing protein [Vicinamibacterales bacterium]